MKKLICILCAMTLAAMVCGCQPTPEESAVQRKENLQDKIVETSEEKVYEEVEERIRLTREISENSKYEVDAEIIGKDVQTLPVYKVASKRYEDGENIERLIANAFPDYGVYDYVNLTKEELMESLAQYQLWLDRYNKNLDIHTGEPLEEGAAEPGMPLAEKYQVAFKPGEEDKIVFPSTLDNLNALVEETKERLASAPSENDLAAPNFIFKTTNHDSSEEISVKLVKDKENLALVVVNWFAEPGTSLMIWNKQLAKSEERGKFSDEFFRGKDMADNAELAGVKAMTDELVKNLGAGYMSLDLVKADEKRNAFKLYYTRDISGLHEGYISNYYSTTPMDSEDGYIDLWGAEYFIIETLNGKIVNATWDNASEIEEVTGNTKALPWEEIWKIAQKQLEYIVTPKSDGQTAETSPRYNDIVISSIELGYTKMLVQNSYDEYQLIPTWNFYGYNRNVKHQGICFLTINAIDGTVMDYNSGY